MAIDFYYPDFKNSNVNISATLAEFLGAENHNPTLPLLREELKKDYKNVVFICFDGLGINPLEAHLKDYDLFLKNNQCVLLSTFPSTTTNATTSLMANLLPFQHGWFGWSLYFENINQNVDIFLNKDSWTGEEVADEKIPLQTPEYYFDNATRSDYEINTVFPEYVHVAHPERNLVFKTENEFFKNLLKVCQKQGKQFCYAYYPDPDHTMHQYGVSSKQAGKVIRSLQNQMQKLKDSTQNTLFIITADHGQIDTTGQVELYKDKKLLSMLKIYPFLDSRSPAFVVKDGMNQQFEEYFNSKYSHDFELHTSAELIEKGVFGDAPMREDFKKYLGDYIAIGTYTHKQALLTAKSERFKGHHASMTEEMLVPLILIKN